MNVKTSFIFFFSFFEALVDYFGCRSIRTNVKQEQWFLLSILSSSGGGEQLEQLFFMCSAHASLTVFGSPTGFQESPFGGPSGLESLPKMYSLTLYKE